MSSYRPCRICGTRLPQDRRRTLCRSALCHAAAAGEPFGTGPRTNPSGGRTGAAYSTLGALIRRRALDGEGCYFCGQGFVWTLPTNHRMAFTVHHLDRLMDGGPAVPDPSRAAPAHRGCNSADGLRQANLRRAQRKAAARAGYGG